MPHLDHFTDDQRTLLVALPYRVGLWVSHSDDAGGKESNEAEMRVLTEIITSFSEDFLKSEFAQELMEETTRRQSEWAEWSDHIQDIPGECARAVGLLSERLDRKELLSFKFNLMEIATDVAMAYREFDEVGDVGYKLKVYAKVALHKFQSLMRGSKSRSLDEFLNISLSEQRALDALAKALDINNERADLHNAARNSA
jgi:hypothetical protein